MSKGSPARRERRAIKRAGVARLERVIIAGPAVAASVAQGIDLVGLVAYHVDTALRALDSSGGDVLAHTVITIGEHPDYPGDLMIEAKAANLKAKSDLADDTGDESAGGLLAGP